MIDPTTAFAFPLKLKYRVKQYTGNFKSGSSNSGKKQLSMQGTGHRRKSYGPFDTFTLGDRSKTKKE